jgi:hypothetical protein
MEPFASETLFNDIPANDIVQWADRSSGMEMFEHMDASSSSASSPHEHDDLSDSLSENDESSHQLEFGFHGLEADSSFPHAEASVPICDFAREAAGETSTIMGQSGPSLVPRGQLLTPKKKVSNKKATTPLRSGSGVSKPSTSKMGGSRKMQSACGSKSSSTDKKKGKRSSPLNRPVQRGSGTISASSALTSRAVSYTRPPFSSPIETQLYGGIISPPGVQSIVCMVNKTVDGPPQPVRCVVSGTSLACNAATLAGICV